MKPVVGRLNIEMARRYFKYDHETGFIERTRERGGQQPGTVVGCERKDGYLSTKFEGKEFLLHRLAWALYFGEEANQEIDHIDGNRRNNRISNLRLSNRSMNNQNRHGPHRNNRLGILGVRFDNASGKFIARIRVNKKLIRLGKFDTAAMASDAYMKARRSMHEGNTL